MFTGFPSRGASGGIPHWFRDDRAHRCVEPHFLSDLGVLNVFRLAHVNLNDEYLPYKHIIGQLILEVS